MPRVLQGLLLAAAAAVLLAAGGAAWVWVSYQRLLEPVDPTSTDPVIVTLAEGSGAQQIARQLEDLGLIRSARAFRFYVRRENVAHRLRAGEYELSRAMSVPEIVTRLVRGEVITYRVTVPEGLTVAETLEIAAATGFFDAAELRRAVAAAAAEWPYLPEGVELQEPLEGYLFPDTYVFTRTTTEEHLIAGMLAGFERVLERVLGEQGQQRLEELGMTVHEIVTLASIIEREARVAEERPLISAVYHNRLRLGMKLDADPTVLYALGRTEGRLLYEDLEVDSPYNTYRYPGLPPGPIASPGAASLEAALYPADVDYLYFVAVGDGSGRHVFARTYEEHLRNVRQYRSRQNSTGS
ncbi:MAG: endolytic transglycosylase MltG [Thermaerobacter sp.]|nr:endolytic transglycosylase MltG [Bacillota bacterium]REJ33923.1 MAG: endolytic transglycosylase MltG [Bacillota bacterium]